MKNKEMKKYLGNQIEFKINGEWKRGILIEISGNFINIEMENITYICKGFNIEDMRLLCEE